jgi:hypothetical protein
MSDQPIEPFGMKGFEIAVEWMRGLYTKYDKEKAEKAIECFNQVYAALNVAGDDVREEVLTLFLRLFRELDSKRGQTTK